MTCQLELIRKANAAVVAHEERRQGVEQRTAQEVKSDNAFVNLWLATFDDIRAKKDS